MKVKEKGKVLFFWISELLRESLQTVFTLSSAVVFLLFLANESWGYVCREGLSPTKKPVNCLKADWQSCPAGSVVYHPSCMRACQKKILARCYKIKRKQETQCQNYTQELSAGQDCPQLAKERREHCAKLSKMAQKECLRRSDPEPCDNIFSQREALCREKKARRSDLCLSQKDKRMEACKRMEFQRQKKNTQICQKQFKICLRSCVPMRWPCRKRCFARRHRCIQKGREKPLKCRQTAAQLYNNCEIANDSKNIQCIRKAEDQKYRCLQTLRKKRVLCLIRVGERYNRCVWKTQDFQLQCWFRQMDRKYLCTGKAYKDCKERVEGKLLRCYRRCPRCKVD